MELIGDLSWHRGHGIHWARYQTVLRFEPWVMTLQWERRRRDIASSRNVSRIYEVVIAVLHCYWWAPLWGVAVWWPFTFVYVAGHSLELEREWPLSVPEIYLEQCETAVVCSFRAVIGRLIKTNALILESTTLCWGRGIYIFCKSLRSPFTLIQSLFVPLSVCLYH